MTRGRSLVLIGCRGCGKTTLGSQLAKRINVPFLDIDQLVEDRRGMTIAEIFQFHGESHFRNLERKALHSLEPTERNVIATGGGAVLTQANQRRIRELGLVMYLRAPLEVLKRRIKNSSRPSLTGQDISDELSVILTEREPIYRNLADREVCTAHRDVEQILDELERLWIGAESS